MNHRPTAGRRLAAAVTAVLAVTAVTGTLAVTPATAAASATTGTAAAAAISLPDDARIVSTGTLGFLSARPDGAGGSAFTWTRFDDGSTEPISGTEGYDTASDAVVTSTLGSYTVRDMRNNTQTTIDPVRELGPGSTVVGVVGQMLYVSVPSFGYQDLYQLQKLNGVMSKTKISYGYDNTSFRVFGRPGDYPLILGTRDVNGVTAYFHTVHKGGQIYDYIRSAQPWDPATATGAVAPAYLAWTERTPEGATTLAVEKRVGTDPVQRIPLGTGPSGSPAVVAGFVGDWVVYGRPGGATAAGVDPVHALTARNVLTGETVKLLDHLTSTATGPDGTLLVRGGTLSEGEGLYRISDAGGFPMATLAVSTGVPTGFRFLGQNVPAVLNTDINHSPTRMTWNLSASNVRLDLTFRNTATGASFTQRMFLPPTTTEYVWNGVLTSGVPAPNGTYLWEAMATPLNGIGGPVSVSGYTKLARPLNSHDLTDNGSADLLARDASGTLWRDDTFDWYADGRLSVVNRTKIGAGFQAYNLIEAAGNHAGGTAADFVARDSAGVLWSFLGKGDGSFAPRTKVGPGWGAYNKVAAGSDLTGDGRPDLVAVDGAGALWLHKATGKWDVPYAPRVRLASGGFNTYNQIAAVGDVAGSAAGDVVARDTAGVLWLFPGKGDGTFAARSRIGGGWAGFSQLVGMGDANNDGRGDLLAYGPNGVYVYVGTGAVSTPFSRTLTNLYAGEGSKFNSLS
ncbi:MULTISPECIES: VCBS repeat-containing protein [unclassified Streptomyces]|uniref:FG-GAP repeat domain-containing protein n=1 Tax=unclassified Streptomyces TaxID=2593676 RepID=UPI0006FDD6EA|nr:MULTISPECIES: VCBS repeat-containing protein [unclassified Streptomyces]KQX59282.1 hypothetical protein ASD33_03025 [Streptomyces sp. Root1304]KRB00543.1 hypothetical protein ASE09_03025 [Streptomyces sp. Root66D1]